MRRSLALLLALASLACSATTTPTEPRPEQFNQGPLSVVGARLFLDGADLVVEIEAEGTPCTRVGKVTQIRSGNVIDLRVDSYWTSEYCILLLVKVRHTVRFPGPLAPGDYIVRVNGLEVTIHI
jgi:hypothetical protein